MTYIVNFCCFFIKGPPHVLHLLIDKKPYQSEPYHPLALRFLFVYFATSVNLLNFDKSLSQAELLGTNPF